jgi:hypothetical protein
VSTPDQQLSTPDITPAQVAAIIQAIIAVALAFGLSISSNERDALIGLSAVIASVLTIADSIIRHGRATGSTSRAKGG